MNLHAQWLIDLGSTQAAPVEGLVLVAKYKNDGRPPEEVAMMEKAASYGAHSVFFEGGRNGKPPVAQAFIFVSTGLTDDQAFAELHQRLWSWGGVPLIYRKTPGLVQLFRCAHKPDFVSPKGAIVCKPIKVLKLAATISVQDAWWDSERLRNGTIWDDTEVCKLMLSASKAAHKRLIDAVEDLNDELNSEGVLKKHIRRKLLILSLLIAYLEERGAFLPGYFGQFLKGATKFFQVLGNGKALIALLDALEERFNGHVFTISEEDRETLRSSTQLSRFAKLIEAHEERTGQLTLWQLYSFKDLPVELISHIYQLFVHDSDSSVYTPPFLVRLMLEEALSWERLDRLHERDEIVLDPACGSGVFLVEAYKRMVLHWRSRNGWKKPQLADLRRLLKKVQGIDLEQGAVELAAFSLCLALCDALEPEEIRSSIKLFPPLAGKTIHHSCFFEAKEKRVIKAPIGVVVGNPPFESSLSTPGAERCYAAYEKSHGALPDKQLAYLFLNEAMEMIAPGGLLSMLQQYNFLYNQQSLNFRRRFLATWDVREILDFISVRGLFQKGGADTKVIVVVASADKPDIKRKLLHAVFRRTGRADAEQGFDIDYYDLHWIGKSVAQKNDAVWRANLLGGGRVLSLVNRLQAMPTLEGLARKEGWDFGEGFIEGQSGNLGTAPHITGKRLLPSSALSEDGIDKAEITTAEIKKFKSSYTPARYTPPLLLIREHMDLQHAVWQQSYLTYKNKIVGFAAPKSQTDSLLAIDAFLRRESVALRAFAACISVRLFTQKATTLSGADIFALPYPGTKTLDLSHNEKLVAEDVVNFMRELVRLGEDSSSMVLSAIPALPKYSSTFIKQINEVYKTNRLRAIQPYTWPGVICQPFAFGEGSVDWSGAEDLKGRLQSLLVAQKTTLSITRIVRLYDDRFVFLLKPDRLRYWLQSIALRDADETLADLREQGF